MAVTWSSIFIFVLSVTMAVPCPAFSSLGKVAHQGTSVQTPEEPGVSGPEKVKVVLDDGTLYEGGWKDGAPVGHGRAIYTDGSVYEGEFAGGLRHGKGIYRWGDGSQYEGEFSSGRRHGHGTQVWPSGRRYEGRWEEGSPLDTSSEGWRLIAVSTDGDPYYYDAATLLRPHEDGVTVRFRNYSSDDDGRYLEGIIEIECKSRARLLEIIMYEHGTVTVSDREVKHWQALAPSSVEKRLADQLCGVN